MKKTLLLILMSVGATVAQATDYDYPYLMLQTADGSQQALSVESLQLTFANGQLVAVNESGTQTFVLTDLSKMFFSATATAGLSKTTASESEEVEVTTVAGISLGRFASASEARKALKHGLYVFKSKSKIQKVIVK